MSSATMDPPELPRWDATVLHESVASRTFVDSLERVGTASLDVLRRRISDYDALATDLDVTVA